MKWIYINIFGWVLRIAFAYLMFTALLSYAYIIALGAMFAIFYIEFFEKIICRRIRKNKGVVC
jgi:hypothetical protein